MTKILTETNREKFIEIINNKCAAVHIKVAGGLCYHTIDKKELIYKIDIFDLKRVRYSIEFSVINQEDVMFIYSIS